MSGAAEDGAMTPGELVEALLGRWARDPAGAMLMCTPDIIYTLNVDPAAHQLGGETAGWDSVTAMMLGIRDVFDYLVYRPRILGVDGNQVRVRIEIVFRHKPSGELLTGSIRAVHTVRDGRIARVDEFVDAAMVETFMRLFADKGP